MLALAGLAAAGWLVVAAMALTPIQRGKSVVAIDGSEPMGTFSTASGPDEKPTPKTALPAGR